VPTNLALDDNLIREAQELGGHKTKKDAVNAALDEYVRLRKRKLLLAELMGAVDFADDWDPRELRNRGLRRIPRDDDC
jgi:Arc/MetJ family transcription regulator